MTNKNPGADDSIHRREREQSQSMDVEDQLRRIIQADRKESEERIRRIRRRYAVKYLKYRKTIKDLREIVARMSEKISSESIASKIMEEISSEGIATKIISIEETK